MAKTAVADPDTKTPADVANAPTPEHKVRMRVARTIARSVWQTGYNAEHPDATNEEKKAAWNDARKDFTKVGMRALKTLEKTGYEVVEKRVT